MRVVHRVIFKKPVPEESHVLDAGMDVRFKQCHIAGLHLFARRRHQLHNPDRADTASSILIEQGLLVALGDHQEIVHIVLGTVFAEELDRLFEFLDLAGSMWPVSRLADSHHRHTS